MLASDIAREAAEAFHTIFGRKDGGPPSTRHFAADHGPVWQALSDGGWLDMGRAEADGGAGLPLTDLVVVAESWGRHLVPLPYLQTMLLHRWSGADLAPLAQDRLTIGLSGAPDQDNVLAPFLGEAGVRYITALQPLTSTDFNTLASGPSGQRTTRDTAENERGKLRSDHAPSLPLGSAPEATSGLTATHHAELAILCSAELIGCCQALLEQTIAYARDRQQFGQAIAEYQAIQHRVANMYRDLEVSRTAVIWGANEPQTASRAVRVVWDRMRAVTENAFQIHGGYGYTWDAGVHFHSRHVWAMGRVLERCGMSLWPN
jgi:alkylation response protein AidB-like acyl-CoA dehydrogenase